MSKELGMSADIQAAQSRLKAAVRNVGIGKGKEIADSEICEIFESFFRHMPQFDSAKYEEQLNLACGYVPSHAEIYLLRRWNTLTQDRKLDAEVLLAPYKSSLLDGLNRMRERISHTHHLRKSVFDDNLAQKLKWEISGYSGEEPFKTNAHAVFIGFLHEEGSGRDFIGALDECFGAIKAVIGTQRIWRLENQLRNLARPLDQYWGTVFSTIIVGRCAQHGLLNAPQDYEPEVGNSNNRAEALITVGGDKVLLEATVCISGRELISGRAIEDAGALADKIRVKVLDKAQQLQGAIDPVLLFLHPHHSMLGPEIQQGLGQALREADARVMGGVVVATNTIHGWKFGYVRNSYPGSKQLPEAVLISLGRIFELKELRLDAHPVEWARWQ